MNRLPEEDTSIAEEELLDKIQAYHDLGMFAEAVKSAEKLRQLSPDDPWGYITLGHAYENNGEVDKAKLCYAEAINKFPQFASVYTNMGYLIEYKEKRRGLALALYEKALELNPNEMWALNNLACTLRFQGRWNEALSYYKRAVYDVDHTKKEEKETFWVTHGLAWAFYKCGNFKEAERLYDLLFERGYDNHEAILDMGCVKYKLGKYSEALDLFDYVPPFPKSSRRAKRLSRLVAKRMSF